MPSLSPAAKKPAPATSAASEHAPPAAMYGYSDEAPFGDVVKDPTPVPTKATDEAKEGDEDASG